METKEFLIYLVLMAGSTYLIRVIPFVAVKNKIENRYVRSFLHYIPYTVLAAMTFPAVLYAADYMAAAAVGFVVAVICAVRGGSLTKVAAASCVAVFVVELAIGVVS